MSAEPDEQDAFYRLVALEEHLTSELENPWADAEATRVSEGLKTTYTKEVEECYAFLIRKLGEFKTTMYVRMNILFLLDKFCTGRKEDEPNAYDVIYEEMNKKLERIIAGVLEIDYSEPINKRPNGNLGWTRKIMAGWRKRGLFETEVLDAIDQKIAIAETATDPPVEEGTKLDEEKMDRRMDADRERAKRDKEERFLRQALDPLEPVSEAWFIHTPDLIPRIDDFYANAPSTISDEAYELLQTENFKYRVSGRMEIYEPPMSSRPPAPSLTATYPTARSGQSPYYMASAYNGASSSSGYRSVPYYSGSHSGSYP
ncbi:uncharacterized protein EV422DRAFT_32657 [Fimicolochytrium jonesii]|uniref:uncharacterized protein n=1 Tax=Fimicolochytrium jonesii TaxID=1396493 RepID=UPI0022FE8F7B|nr:uncharacterized protein EV422DRAFT_32657 [Fimicolochytrium jonesii]KAI8827224.1 hypothetical protein EV422DRAFT_32657 [Fimicolochytrium jonesii]